jgi:ATP-dependent DNA ligase
MFNDDYPVLVDALKSLKGQNFTIDREVAALDQHVRSSFQLLQSYGEKNRPCNPVLLGALDFIYIHRCGATIRKELTGANRLANPPIPPGGQERSNRAA